MEYEIKFTRTFSRDLRRQVDSFREYRSEKAVEKLTNSVFATASRLKTGAFIGQKTEMKEFRSILIPYDFRIYYKVRNIKEII